MLFLFFLFSLNEESICLTNTKLKGIKAGEVLLHLSNGKLNQHTGNLGSFFWANYKTDIVKDQIANLLLDKRISFSDGTHDFGGLEQISIWMAHLVRVSKIGLSWGHTRHWRTDCLIILVMVGLFAMLLLLLLALVLWMSVILLTMVIIRMVFLLTLRNHSRSFLLIIISFTSCSLFVLSLRTSSILSCVISLSSRFVLALDYIQQLWNNGHKIWRSLKITPFKLWVISKFCSSILFKICFVNCFFNLNLSIFLDLIVIDYQTSSIKHSTKELMLCFRSFVRILETNKSIIGPILALVQSNTFNLTILCK